MMSSRYVSLDGGSAIGVTRREIGGKASNLARLRELGQPVPAYYVVTVEAFRTALAAQQPARTRRGIAAMTPGCGRGVVAGSR